jgi:hypothetical protein
MESKYGNYRSKKLKQRFANQLRMEFKSENYRSEKLKQRFAWSMEFNSGEKNTDLEN